MLLPAYLLAGFPKLLLTLTILFPPFQHVSKLLLIVASLPAMMQFDNSETVARPLICQVKAVKSFHSGLLLISPAPRCDLVSLWFLMGKSFLHMSANCLLLLDTWFSLPLPMALSTLPLVSFYPTMNIAKRKTTQGACLLNLPHMSLIFPSLNFLLLSYFQFVCAAPQFSSLAQQVFSSIVYFPQSAL